MHRKISNPYLTPKRSVRQSDVTSAQHITPLSDEESSKKSYRLKEGRRRARIWDEECRMKSENKNINRDICQESNDIGYHKISDEVSKHVSSPKRQLEKSDDESPTKRHYSKITSDFHHIDFHGHYEILRLFPDGNMTALQKESIQEIIRCTSRMSFPQSLVTFCRELHSKFDSQLTYDNLLESPLFPGNVSYTGKMFMDAFGNPSIKLLPPQEANDCRIYRKYGTHRFLTVYMDSDVHISYKSDMFKQNFSIAWRKYCFLWVEANQSPQRYFLFAEMGHDLDGFISVNDAMNFCVPIRFNPEISISKVCKRMKLSFSKTTASGILPKDCLRKIPDKVTQHGGRKIVLTDGCGLISRDGINYVWYHFCKSKNEKFLESKECRDDVNYCPYTSFQARIGSLKGMWVLDESLGEGIKLCYRDSQKKFNIPMRSMAEFDDIFEELHIESSESLYDEHFDTVEVCKWSEAPKPGRLNKRLIQVLECRGVSADFFINCALESVKWLQAIEGTYDEMISVLRSELNAMPRDRNSLHMIDDNILLRMICAGVPKSERFFSILIQKFVSSKINRLREKAHYTLKKSAYVHILPDHYEILGTNEIFVSIKGEELCKEEAYYVLAIRFPAFFAEDILKLKVVGRKEMRKRCSIYRQDIYGNFFENLKNCAILSTIPFQSYSVAEVMSGGDYDGDQAWICWDKAILAQFEDDSIYKDFSHLDLDTSNQPLSVLSKRYKEPDDMVMYADCSREHNYRLGSMCNRLDTYIDRWGFDDNRTRELAKQAFIQVDNPTFSQKVLCDGTCDKAHWQVTISGDDSDQDTQHTYHSNKALGKVWDTLDELRKSFTKQDFEPNFHVRKIVEEKFLKDELWVQTLRNHADKLFRKYNEKARAYFLTTDEDTGYHYFKELWLNARNEYFKDLSCENDRSCAAAILYEVVEGAAIQSSSSFQNNTTRKMIPYSFAWRVAHDYLTRIISDGDSSSEFDGFGVSISVCRKYGRFILGPTRKYKEGTCS